MKHDNAAKGIAKDICSSDICIFTQDKCAISFTVFYLATLHDFASIKSLPTLLHDQPLVHSQHKSN
jgi:hypothetical protein